MNFLGTVAMWWLYFHIGQERGAQAIEHSDDPGRVARVAFTYAHIPIVAGIVVSAVAAELMIAHPSGHTGWGVAASILGGPALFLAGNLWFKALTARLPPLSHLVGLALFAAGSSSCPGCRRLRSARWRSASWSWSRCGSGCRSGPAPGGLPDGEVAMAAEVVAHGPDIASVVVLEETLRTLGVPEEEVADHGRRARARPDALRAAARGGIMAAGDLIRGNIPGWNGGP